jgi:type I restriction enzyme S subunit
VKDKSGDTWSVKPLSDVANVVYGTRVVRKLDQGTKYPVYGGGGATFFVDQTNRSDCVIVARFGMSEGCVRPVKGDFFLNDSGLTVRNLNDTIISQEFLDAQLLGRQPEIYALGRGTAQKNLDVSAFKQLPIAIPPLEEQRKIVAILDEAFEGLARARENAKVNLKNARELFEEAVNHSFHRAGKGAKTVKLGQISTFRNGLNYSRSSNGEEVRIVGVGDFKNNFLVPIETLSSIKLDGKLGEDDLLKSGDILAVRSNGNRELIGRTMLVPDVAKPISFSGFTIRVRLNSSDLMPSYLCAFMKTKDARAKLAEGGGGANISNLNQRLLSDLPIAFPSTETQRETLDHIDLVRDATSELERHYSQKLQDLDDLRQSILQKAFAGELT